MILNKYLLYSAIILISAVIFPVKGYSGNSTVSDQDIKFLPSYCKARFADPFERNKRRSVKEATLIKKWKKIGNDFIHLHHY